MMLPVPASDSATALADWVEASCLVDSIGRISESEVRAVLESATAGGPDGADWVWLELTKRAAVLRGDYPFLIERGSVVGPDSTSSHLVYRMLLFLSIRSSIPDAADSRVFEPAKLFEYVTTAAAGRYLGGSAIRIGSPREGDVPTAFRDLIPYLCDELNEGPPGSVLKPATKDAGADVVAWRPFSDDRAGQLIILAQCATGAHWADKIGELSVPEWQLYVRFAVPPMQAFAIPHVERDPQLWLLYNTRGGIVFDRLRIVEAAGRELGCELEPKVAEWCSEEAERLAALAETAGW